VSRRAERLGQLLRREIAFLLQHRVNDPRLSGVLSVTRVELSPDLRHASVFVSVLDEEEKKHQVMEALATASGFIRHELAGKLTWRRVPQIAFHRDDSLEKGARVLNIMKDLNLPRD